MAEVNAVIGFLPDATAQALASGKQYAGSIEVCLESGNQNMLVRINPKDVAGVLLGASKKGETGVQVFLNDKASVETVSRALATDLRLRPINDLTLWPWRPPFVVIYAPPDGLKHLFDLQRATLVKK